MKNNRNYRDQSWLYQKHQTNHWSADEIAAFCGVGTGVIVTWLTKFNITQISTLNRVGVCSKYARSINHPHQFASDVVIDSPITGIKSLAPHCPTCATPITNTKCTECGFVLSPDNTHYARLTADLIALTSSWSDAVLTRDNHQCIECSSRDELVVHYLVPFENIRDRLMMEYGDIVDFNFNSPENRLLFCDAVRSDSKLSDSSAGVTLCRSCRSGALRHARYLKNSSMYVYHAKVVSNYDGDTLDVDIDVGFGLVKRESIRLFGIDTAELRGGSDETKVRAVSAKYALKSICIPGRTIQIKTYKSGKYGRFLATVIIDGIDVNQRLIDANLAKTYMI